jgi:hypothetical protein
MAASKTPAKQSVKSPGTFGLLLGLLNWMWACSKLIFG